METDCHPLLRGGGGRKDGRYNHGFSRDQMQSLAAVCETIIPPLSEDRIGKDVAATEAVRAFFEASGSRGQIPDEVGMLILPPFYWILVLGLYFTVFSYCGAERIWDVFLFFIGLKSFDFVVSVHVHFCHSEAGLGRRMPRKHNPIYRLTMQ